MDLRQVLARFLGRYSEQYLKKENFEDGWGRKRCAIGYRSRAYCSRW